MKAQVIRHAQITDPDGNVVGQVGPLICFTDSETGAAALVPIVDHELDKLGDSAAVESVRAKAVEALAEVDPS